MFSATLILVFASSAYLAFGVPMPSELGRMTARNVQSVVMGHGLSFPMTRDPGHRSKRQAGWDTDDSDEQDQSTRETDALLCLLVCSNQLKRAAEPFKNNERVQTGAGSKMMKPDLNLTRFNEMCSAMRPSVECFDRCPTSTMKTSLKPTLEPIRYLCIDRYQDYLDNARCTRKLDRITESRCKSGCRRYESALNKTVELGQKPYLKTIYSIGEIREMLSGTCQFIECYQACSVPLIRTACGETAAELEAGIVQKMFVAMQGLNAMQGGSALPEACQRLTRPQRPAIESRNQYRRQYSSDDDVYDED